MKLERINYSSGAPLEEKVGYSRMVKIGPYIKIGGTTSVQPDGTVYGEDAYEQTKYVLEKQIKLLEQAGATKENVFSVFIYTTDISQGAKICEAYAEFFHDFLHQYCRYQRMYACWWHRRRHYLDRCHRMLQLRYHYRYWKVGQRKPQIHDHGRWHHWLGILSLQRQKLQQYG